jgi:hypothetical protein
MGGTKQFLIRIMTMRKIIQITSIPATESVNPVLIALCNDGTVWGKSINPMYETNWFEVPNIPQIELDNSND